MEYNLNNTEIGNRIRSIRENMSMNRENFSEMVDISEVFLGQIERGESSLSLKTLNNIIAFTGASADFILYGKNSDDDYSKKIDRILNLCSKDTSEFIYNIINDVYKFNKKTSKNTKQ
jgi:transcriptional regulator with XRE-family HTH domain